MEVEQKATLAARQHLHDMESSALQHSRELTAAQNDVVSSRNELRNKDQELKAKQQSVDSLEERLRKEVTTAAMSAIRHLAHSWHAIDRPQQGASSLARSCLSRAQGSQECP